MVIKLIFFFLNFQNSSSYKIKNKKKKGTAAWILSVHLFVVSKSNYYMVIDGKGFILCKPHFEVSIQFETNVI